jgi:hypothetical protein
LDALARSNRCSICCTISFVLGTETADISALRIRTWNSLGYFVKRCGKGIFILAPVVGKKRSQEEEATAEDAERNSGQPRIYGFRGVHVFDRVVAEY